MTNHKEFTHEFFGINLERTTEIVGSLVAVAAWRKDPENENSDLLLVQFARDNYTGEERDFAFLMIGKLSATHEERRINPAALEVRKLGLVQKAFDTIRDLDVESLEDLKRIMTKKARREIDTELIRRGKFNKN